MEEKRKEGGREKGARNVCLFCFVVGMIKYLTRANFREHRFSGVKSFVARCGFAQRSIQQLLAHILTNQKKKVFPGHTLHGRVP